MPSDACPCGSGDPYAGCCGLYHDGLPAPTALALMRSRYAAFVKGAIDYLLDTHDPDTRGKVSRATLEQSARDTLWLGLEIDRARSERGGEDDADGVVEFTVRGVVRGQPFVQRERSRFRKLDGQWLYIDGTFKR